MGESKRRKAANPNYGKPKKPKNDNIINLMPSVPVEILYEVYRGMRSTHWLSGIEVPKSLDMLELLEETFSLRGCERDKHKSTIEELAKACHKRRQVDYSVWRAIYEILASVPSLLLLNFLKGKHFLEIDKLLRSMSLFPLLCPDPLEDEGHYILDRNGIVVEARLRKHIEAQYLYLFGKYDDLNRDEFQQFNQRVCSYISKLEQAKNDSDFSFMLKRPNEKSIAANTILLKHKMVCDGHEVDSETVTLYVNQQMQVEAQAA